MSKVALPPPSGVLDRPSLRAEPARPAPVANGVVVSVVVVGLLFTGVVTWTSWLFNNRNENHLLRLQTLQAGEVLTAAVPDTEAPLATALDIASATDGDAGAFKRFIAPYVATEGTFVSVSLWQVNRASVRELDVVGAALAIRDGDPSECLGEERLQGTTLRGDQNHPGPTRPPGLCHGVIGA